MSTALDHTLAALADPARRTIVELLRDGPLRASELADELSVSRPAMSRHLAILRRAGLVTQEVPETDGRTRMVQLRREGLAELRGWIEEVEAFWGDQLASFKAHAERKPKKKTKRK